MIFFHNPDEENGYLSNWYLSDFIHNGIKYASMEQYMMYQKAILFNDNEIAAEILKTTDAAVIKALGRKVSGFDEEIWDRNKEKIVCSGLLRKFLHNRELAYKLISTGNQVIAECAVKDRIWGIGLSMNDERRFDESLWRGRNLLGQCLMTVREKLKKYYGCRSEK